MIRHRETGPWLPLSVYVSDNAAATSNAADHLGGPALANLALSVIDEIQLGYEPTRRVFTTIARLLLELEARMTGPAKAEDGLLRASVEQDFAIRAEILALMDDLRYQIVASQMAPNQELGSYQRGAA